MNITKRIIIHASDVILIAGLSGRSARRLLSKIRTHCGKSASAFITIDEFCDFTGLKKEQVTEYIK